ncbi:hypothetical protein [Olleya aquimaris]|uniref:Lipocalin-like domain-containing protein n=1 Tax=Olleya aquimaris TaxID=639310 RepID=A0A327RJ85_9FLAO|nr:hypothetical protein [Olleya aquimaris]RAJ17050.1 hypothetical protein LY08_00828 [Olleya aquimaris]
MKHIFYIGILLMLSFSLMSFNCSNDDDNNNPNDDSQQIAQIQSTAISGTWIVSSYIDSGQDETNDFSNYQFTFGTDGIITADNGTSSLTGTWSVTTSNNDSSSSSSDIDFNIFFQVPDTSVFEDLNDDWDISSYSDTTISLTDVSGGNGSTDTLIFVKN